MVSGLAACQKKISTGYLSAYPTQLFEHLADGKPVWAPFYTYHKIMAGLLDMYLLAGNTDPLQVAEGMGQWAQEFLSGFSVDQRQRILRTEYGGMNEVLVNLAATTQTARLRNSRSSPCMRLGTSAIRCTGNFRVPISRAKVPGILVLPAGQT